MDLGIMTLSFQKLSHHHLFFLSNNVYYNKIRRTLSRSELSPSMAEDRKILSKTRALTRCHTLSCSQSNSTVGILGGVSALSTLIFLEKFLWLSSRHGGEEEEELIPFVVCSDPSSITRDISSPLPPSQGRNVYDDNNYGMVVENLRRKRAFLELCGARCIVMPCHVCHVWHREVSEGCSVPFFDLSDCVACELKEAKLRPLEPGSSVKIGVLSASADSVAGSYQDKLQRQFLKGFEAVVPDKATMGHIVIPIVEALKRKDKEGAKNLLRVAIQILLVRGVNKVILVSDEFQGLLPHDDPLVKKCIDPMDALARWTIKWAQEATKKVH